MTDKNNQTKREQSNPSLLKTILMGAITGLLTGGQPPPKGFITIKRIPSQTAGGSRGTAVGRTEQPASADDRCKDAAKAEPSLLKTVLVGAVTGLLTGGCPPPKGDFTIKTTQHQPSTKAKDEAR